WTAAEHGQRAVLHVRRGIQVVEPGLRLRRGLPALRVHLRGDGGAAAAAALGAGSVSSAWPRVLVNGSLLGAAALTVAPLVWMVSVSLMSPGEASSFPPPLVPSRPTLANYRDLFAHAGMGRYLVNSVILTAAVTLGSLSVNVAAGYAFAKLRF